MNASELVQVKVYFTEEEFAEIVRQAQIAEIRPLSLKPKVVKEHGGAEEYAWNTKYISKFMKYCVDQWKEGAAERAVKKAEWEARQKALLDEGKKLGVIK